MKRVTGIGGIFFKCENPKAMLNWYQEHLGISPFGETGLLNGIRRMIRKNMSTPSGLRFQIIRIISFLQEKST